MEIINSNINDQPVSHEIGHENTRRIKGKLIETNQFNIMKENFEEYIEFDNLIKDCKYRKTS
jgi:hypothetical protein